MSSVLEIPLKPMERLLLALDQGLGAPKKNLCLSGSVILFPTLKPQASWSSPPWAVFPN